MTTTQRSLTKQGHKSTYYVITAILVLSLVINVIQFSYTSAPYQELQTKYGILYNQYQTLSQEYSSLSDEYNHLRQVALLPPYCSISGGEIKWTFYDLKRNIVSWEMPMDTYRYYVSMNKPVQTLGLKAATGIIKTYDMRPYIQPSFFENTIVNLTEGRSAVEFAREVDNIKNQIVVYGKGIGEAPYQFPAETLTEGRGVCADTTILMASMLIEGNRQGHYDMKIYICYVQMLPDGTLVSDSKSITEANHAIVKVQFLDGTSWTMETTTNYFYTYSQAYTGWQFEVTNIE